MNREELLSQLDFATRNGDVELARAISDKLDQIGKTRSGPVENFAADLRSAGANALTGPSAMFAGLTDLASIGAEKLGLPKQRRISPLVSDLRNSLAGRDDSNRLGPGFVQGLTGGVFARAPVRDVGFLRTLKDMGTNVAVAAGMGASQGENDKEQLQGAALAGVTGLGVDALLRSITTGKKLQPERQRVVNEASSEKIPLTGGQMTGNRTDLQTEGNFSQIRMFSQGVQRRIDKQENALMKAVSKRLGIDAYNLGPEELRQARNVAVANIREPVKGGLLIDVNDSEPLFGLQQKVINAPRAVEKKPAMDAVRDAFDLVGSPVTADKFIEIRSNLNEARGKAFDNGDKFSADVIDGVIKFIEDSALSSVSKAQREQFRTGLRQYANLMTMEDALRKSGASGGWLGNVSPGKIAPAIERNFPGGMLYDRSNMAPVGRIGSVMKAGEALPESRHYIPGVTDIQNTVAYARLNNPVNKWAMQNPEQRQAMERMLRTLGIATGAELSD